MQFFHFKCKILIVIKILISFIFRILNKQANSRGPLSNEIWSGEATRKSGFAAEETRVDVNISSGMSPGSNLTENQQSRKERPVWMVESTIVGSEILVIKIINKSSQFNSFYTQFIYF